MLESLSIRDFAIVSRQELEFRDGFTAITGETGAGKSLIVDALSLLSGRRADTDQIRSGADKAELCGVFALSGEHPALSWLREAELDDDSECLLRRVIARSGRSRAWINGSPVTLNQLQELGALLVEIHGQNEHIRLNHASERYRLLDSAGAYTAEIEAVEECHAAWQAARAELERLRQASVLDPGELELLNHQLNELSAHALPPDQVQALEMEHKRLTRGNEFLGALEFSAELLSGNPEGTGSPGIAGQINRAISRLSPLADSDSGIAEAVRMLEEAAINCQESAQVIQRVSSDVDLSPERLDAVERQLGQLHDLARKHRVEIEDLMEAHNALAERIETSSSLEARLAECEKTLETARRDYEVAADRLHEQRCERAATLAATVTEAMQQLAMDGGEFRIEVERLEDAEPSARGSDRVALLVSATPGVEPAPLRKVASGGELSRISLAIKVADSRLRSASGPRSSAAPVQIFDEIDAGVGGDTANAVGKLLRAVAGEAQALCVTHLAQVAARAHQQVKIEKQTADGAVTVQAVLLGKPAREAELARMLSGTVSDNSLAHARELIENSAA